MAKINDTLSISPRKIYQSGDIDVYRCGLSIFFVRNHETMWRVIHPEKVAKDLLEKIIQQVFTR
jgi:hypothetical protein